MVWTFAIVLLTCVRPTVLYSLGTAADWHKLMVRQHIKHILKQ